MPIQKLINKQNKGPRAFYGVVNVIVILASISLGKIFPVAACTLALIYFSIVLISILKRRNATKTLNGNTKIITTEVIGYASIIVIITSIAVANLWQSDGSQQNINGNTVQSSAGVASDTVKLLKQQTNFPQKVDELTDLVDVTSDGANIRYHYQFHDADTSNISDNSLYELIKPKVCKSSDIKPILDAGISVEYFYIVKETGEQFVVSIRGSDCS